MLPETARAPEGLESYKLAEKPHQHPSEEDEEKLKVWAHLSYLACQQSSLTLSCNHSTVY